MSASPKPLTIDEFPAWELAIEYADTASIQVYVMLVTDRPELTVRRRSNGWDEETVAGIDAVLSLPEIGVSIPLAAIYRR